MFSYARRLRQVPETRIPTKWLWQIAGANAQTTPLHDYGNKFACEIAEWYFCNKHLLSNIYPLFYPVSFNCACRQLFSQHFPLITSVLTVIIYVHILRNHWKRPCRHFAYFSGSNYAHCPDRKSYAYCDFKKKKLKK